MKILNAIAIFLIVWFAIRLFNMFRNNSSSTNERDPNVHIRKDKNPGAKKRKDPDLSDAEYIDYEEVKD